MTRVKICGITSIRDAKVALEFGADAIGLVFAESPRQVNMKMASKISRSVGPWIATVGVFVNENARNIHKAISECCLSAVQLHGDEPLSLLNQLSSHKVIKAFRVSTKADIQKAKIYKADAYLFDTRVNGIYGGSGKKFDWNLLNSNFAPKPFILSGGLDPGNVKNAVRLLNPYGVDVSSGVEKSPGKKDPWLVKEFIRNAKNN